MSFLSPTQRALQGSKVESLIKQQLPTFQVFYKGHLHQH